MGHNEQSLNTNWKLGNVCAHVHVKNKQYISVYLEISVEILLQHGKQYDLRYLKIQQPQLLQN